MSLGDIAYIPDVRHPQLEVLDVFLGLLDDGEKLLLRLVDPPVHLYNASAAGSKVSWDCARTQ